MEIDWQTSNIKIIEPEPEDDEQGFVGKELKIVEEHPKFIKHTLKTMGIKNIQDRDQIIQKIKILIQNKENENEPTDVWDKNDVKNKSFSDGE